MRNLAVWIIVIFVVQDALYHMLEWLERRESRKRLGEIRDQAHALAALNNQDRKETAARITAIMDVVDAMRLQVMAQELRHERTPTHDDQRLH